MEQMVQIKHSNVTVSNVILNVIFSLRDQNITKCQNTQDKTAADKDLKIIRGDVYV